MNSKSVITASMLALGALVFVSGGWFEKVRGWVYAATGKG